MIIPTPLLAVIETTINAWLKLDDATILRLAPMAEKIIRLHITGLALNLYFLPTATGFQVLGNYPDEKEGGIVDATIHGSPIALIRLSTAKNSGETLLKSDVEIDGNMAVAEEFSAILREVDIDWEEILSKLVGDIVAHQAGQATRTTSQWLSESADALKMNMSEYLTEESRVSLAEAEIQDYLDQVDNMRMDVDRLAARVSLLTEDSTKTKPQTE